MTDVTIERSVPIPQAAVAPRLLTVLERYVARNDVILTLDLGSTGANVSVPVTIDLDDVGRRTASVVPIGIRATHHARWFPIFHGEIRNVATGPMESTLRLDGGYDTPLGPLGEVTDATILGHAAQRGLSSFLDRVRGDVIEEVRRSEAEIRAHRR